MYLHLLIDVKVRHNGTCC